MGRHSLGSGRRRRRCGTSACGSGVLATSQGRTDLRWIPGGISASLHWTARGRNRATVGARDRPEPTSPDLCGPLRDVYDRRSRRPGYRWHSVASDRQSDGVSASSLEQKTVLRADQVASGFGTISFADDVVMHVRSPVASYWRGQVFDDFDGETWTPERSVTLGISGRRFFRRNAVRYTQTFFTPEDGPREFLWGIKGWT